MFYRNIVVFQNLSNGRVVQISKEPNGLYICGSKIVNAGALGATNDLIESKDIWYKRLGHISEYVFVKIPFLKTVISSENYFKKNCIICPQAK